MRKVRLSGIVLMMLALLACNLPRVAPRASTAPTATPYVMCTPPACKSDEVYYCPGECLGGCGTTCVTPTAEPPTPTHTSEPTFTPTPTLTPEPTSSPTNTPFVMCTPPACAANEVYYCPDACPGGCGATCVTPTPGPCVNTWVPELATAMQGMCPHPAEIGWAAQQPFERGFMLWLQPSKSIYVFFDNYGGQSYRVYNDTFKEGDPESDPSLVPPAGLLQPVRGFGLVWRSYPEVRDNLGWATAVESGFDTWRQSYQGVGMHNLTIWVKDINQKIYELDPMGSKWEIYTP